MTSQLQCEFFLVAVALFSDIGDTFTVEVVFVHPRARGYGMDSSPQKNDSRWHETGGWPYADIRQIICASYRREAGGNVCALRAGYHPHDVRVEQRGDAEDARTAEACRPREQRSFSNRGAGHVRNFCHAGSGQRRRRCT